MLIVVVNMLRLFVPLFGCLECGCDSQNSNPNGLGPNPSTLNPKPYTLDLAQANMARWRPDDWLGLAIDLDEGIMRISDRDGTWHEEARSNMRVGMISSSILLHLFLSGVSENRGP